MTGKENPIQAATRIFDESIYGIRDSQIEGLKDIAARTVDRIRDRELLVVGNNPTFRIPTVTGFDLTEVAPGPRSQYAPVIVIDIEKIQSLGPEAIKDDLSRTVAVADQYPFNGFQRRYRAVYEDALQAQTQWLTETNTPGIQLDPRNTARETILKSLLGDARYYADVGFADWQKAIESYRRSGQDISVIPILDKLKDATGHFIVMRQRFVPTNYQIARQQIGEDYVIKWGAEKRAEGIAYSLMGASIYARMPGN